MPQLAFDRAPVPSPARGALVITLACALALLAARAAVAWGHAALPPPAWLAPLLGLGLVLVLWREGSPVAWRDLPVAAAIGFAASSAHLESGLVRGHDWMHHLWGAAAFQNAWSAGDLLPIWLHHLGLGMPMPMFYGPLAYWAMAPISLAGGGPATLLGGSFALSGALAGVSAWIAAAVWSRDRRAALVAALAWSFAPYRLLDANYRGALGESWSLALLPLVLVAFDRLLAAPTRRRFAVAAASVALLTLAHPLSLALLAVILPAVGFAHSPRLWRTGRGGALVRGALRGAGAGFAGIALAGFLALPLLVERQHLLLDPDAARATFASHGIEVRQLVLRAPWDRFRSRAEIPEPPPDHRMPFYFGWSWLVSVGGGALAATRRPRDGRLPFAVLATVGGVALACSLHLATPVLARLPGITILQFPWRFLGPASAAGSLALAALVAAAARRWGGSRARFAALLPALLLLAEGFAYLGAVERFAPWSALAAASEVRSGLVRTVEVPEPWPPRILGVFLPPWRGRADVTEVYHAHSNYFTPAARRAALSRTRASIGLISYVDGTFGRPDATPYARLWRDGATTPNRLDYERAGGRISVHLPVGAVGRVEVSEQYFPGWQVRGGGRWREVTPTADGLLAATIDPGDRTVRFRFHRWRWDRSLGWLLSAVSALALGTAARRPERAPIEAAP
jgi:hypothetical protein